MGLLINTTEKDGKVRKGKDHRYTVSEKGRARHKRFRESLKGKEAKKRQMAKYNSKSETIYLKYMWALKKRIQTKPQLIVELEIQIEELLYDKENRN